MTLHIFLSRVDECLRVKVFCSLAARADLATAGGAQSKPDPKAAKGQAAGAKGGKKKNASKDPNVAEADTAHQNLPKLESGEKHLVGEAVIRLRDAFDARRTKGFCWHSLSDISKGGAGISCFAGQLGLHIETVDFSAARMPKPPPEVAHVECQTDLAQERAARKAAEKATQLALPRKKSRFAEKMMPVGAPAEGRPALKLNRAFSAWVPGRDGRTTPRNLLPSPAPTVRWPAGQDSGKQAQPRMRASENFRTIAPGYDHLYDFDGVDASVGKAKPNDKDLHTPRQEEHHWQEIQKKKDVLLGVPGARAEK